MITIRNLLLICLLLGGSGCTTAPEWNPLPDWKRIAQFNPWPPDSMPPNWEHTAPYSHWQVGLPPFPDHKTITDDYQNYLRSEKMWPQELMFFEGKNGCHAVYILNSGVKRSITGAQIDMGYFLIYDKQEMRTKVEKFKWSIHRM